MRCKNGCFRYLVCVFLIGASLFLAGCHDHKKQNILNDQEQAAYLKQYTGKWIIVNYWATWCKPCLQELPELNRLQQTQKDKLIVLGINFDGALTPEAHRFIDPLKLEFSIWNSFPAKNFGVKEINALPMTLIIQPNGKLFKIVHGPQTAEGLLKIINTK